MRCPVCGTEYEMDSIDNNCGFANVGKTFINQEEEEHRNNYNESNILPPINWLELFKQNVQAKHLFEISIPAAIKRKANIESLKDQMIEDDDLSLADVILEHIAIVSKSEKLLKHCINTIEKLYNDTVNFRKVVSHCVERESDLASILTNLSPSDILVFDISYRMKKDVIQLFSKILNDNRIEITIGSGQGARIVDLSLVPFTTIFIADSIESIPNDIVQLLSTVIELDFSQNEMDELEIREISSVYDIQLTKENIKVVKECTTQKDFKSFKSILRLVSDYLYLHTEIQQPLDENTMREIITRFY